MGSKSPGITSLVELLKEYVKSFHLLEEEEEEEKVDQQQHPNYCPDPYGVGPVVKAYTLLCTFPTRVLVEGGGDDSEGGRGGARREGSGFDHSAFVKGLTLFFNVSIGSCVTSCVGCNSCY